MNKTLSYILAAYMLTLAFYPCPCMDVSGLMEKASHALSVLGQECEGIAHHHHNHDEDHEENCTPFCMSHSVHACVMAFGVQPFSPLKTLKSQFPPFSSLLKNDLIRLLFRPPIMG